MDKSKYGKTALGIFIVHAILTILVMVGLMSKDRSVFQAVFRMGGFVMIVYPIIGGLIYIIVSVIGMIKNKKLLPYLVCPVISFVLWVILGGALSVYI